MTDVTEDGTISRRALLASGIGATALLASGAAVGRFEVHRHPGLRDRIFGCGSTPPLPESRYAITNGSFASAAMNAAVPWQLAMPAGSSRLDGRIPLVIALPGRDGAPNDMVAAGTGLAAWATAAGLSARIAIASPGAGGSTYYHPRADGTDSLAMVTDEFIPMIEHRFPVGGDRARRAIIGVSMGGFGSLLVAQRRPDLVCAAVGSSPAVFESYRAAIAGHPGTFDSYADWRRWGLWTHLSSLDKVPIRGRLRRR